ncbi:MAG: SUMF1/EgtB/PvdO family nonheme iron enzyme [Ignavibacteriae bacterium]|nr:SUMF1/EgtB/PvdO family nonheme iron enzyme [Ignavibacteriota bacterium]
MCVSVCVFAGCDTGTDTKNPPSTFIEMVTLNGGAFRMGNINGSGGQQDELPVHQVTVHPFMISRCEVTQELYVRATGRNPSIHTGVAKLPVENIDWYEAVAFCNSLSALENFTPCYTGITERNVQCDFGANGYRLPTEAEWEFACRAGTSTEYSSGDNVNALSVVGWHAGNSEGTTHPVGEREANGFGLFDMHGNVLEWCWDWYSASAYGANAVQDPRGPASGAEKVLRGGSAFLLATNHRSSCRSAYLTPGTKRRDTGMRVVRSIP